jgi:hypothetical protein
MKNFFGKQEELHKFEKLSSILIPDIVIEELKARYKRDFSDEKHTFLDRLLNNVVNHNIALSLPLRGTKGGSFFIAKFLI